MAEFVVIDVSQEDDLSEFSQYLWRQKVPHRIVESEQRQLLLVGSENDARQVKAAFEHYLTGSIELPTIERPETRELANFGLQLLKTPVTLILMVLSIAGYFLVASDEGFDLVSYLTFFEFKRVGFQVQFYLPQGEYWRLITPIFLHFSLLHIVFNMLWLWDLGRRIELLQGTDRMIGIVMVMGLGSNITQFLFAEVGVFGGMSGVIYGLLGYGWMWSLLVPDRSLNIPKPVLRFMLGWLVLCMLGFAELLGAGAVANAAHVGGLVMGMILGVGAALIAKASGQPSNQQ